MVRVGVWVQVKALVVPVDDEGGAGGAEVAADPSDVEICLDYAAQPGEKVMVSAGGGAVGQLLVWCAKRKPVTDIVSQFFYRVAEWASSDRGNVRI